MKIFIRKYLSRTWLAACFLLVAGSLGQTIFAQTTGCDCAPDEIIFELGTPANLSAIAAQYKLRQTPLGQVGTPPTYRMEIDRTLTNKTPTQIVTDMAGDTRVTKPEVNRKLSAAERQGLGQSDNLGLSGNPGRLAAAQKVTTGNGFPIKSGLTKHIRFPKATA